ncbi:MAG: hypothetical protein VW397_01225 [Candidatus Margulisiibacteriota bacterium]
MKFSVQNKAKTIYGHFSKAPILEMVQYLINENVDAQVLHQLKLIDQRTHKNPYVTSYGEKIYASYERICKILVTYPSLTFENYELKIIKDKESQFVEEYLGDPTLEIHVAKTALELLNRALSFGIEAGNGLISELRDHLQVARNMNQLVTFLKEGCGEDYRGYIDRFLNRSNSDF